MSIFALLHFPRPLAPFSPLESFVFAIFANGYAITQVHVVPLLDFHTACDLFCKTLDFMRSWSRLPWAMTREVSRLDIASLQVVSWCDLLLDATGIALFIISNIRFSCPW